MDTIDFTGRTIDRYIVVALIRSGGQGRVYRGRDEVLRRDVAIKVLNGPATALRRTRCSLIAEARALCRLSHPHVAGVYDFVTHDARDFLVMEFIAGVTLDEVLADGPLPPTEVIRLGVQLARGLAAIHDANIVHCDIKPSNLKITASGTLKIVDFGMAQELRPLILDDASTTIFSVAGTLPYMAPEVLHGGAADQRSDIFSTGAVLYEMATARRAFPQCTLPSLIDAIDAGRVLPPSHVNSAISSSLEDVVLGALRRRPAWRYQSAAQLADMLGSLSAPGREVMQPTHKRQPWHSLVVAARKLLATMQREPVSYQAPPT